MPILNGLLLTSFIITIINLMILSNHVTSASGSDRQLTGETATGSHGLDRVRTSYAVVDGGPQLYSSYSSRQSSSTGFYHHGGSGGPHRSQSQPETLMERLGDDFDPSWMSIEQPPLGDAMVNGSVKMTLDVKLLQDLTTLNFTFRDEHGEEHEIRPTVRKYLEKWLLHRASCQVHFVWEDLGALFWPRWVKRGICDAMSSCSWPPGMHCVPEESQTIRLLRWQCHQKKDRKINYKAAAKRVINGGKWNRKKEPTGSKFGRTKEKMKCRWKKVPYPVTAECFCSCWRRARCHVMPESVRWCHVITISITWKTCAFEIEKTHKAPNRRSIGNMIQRTSLLAQACDPQHIYTIGTDPESAWSNAHLGWVRIESAWKDPTLINQPAIQQLLLILKKTQPIHSSSVFVYCVVLYIYIRFSWTYFAQFDRPGCRSELTTLSLGRSLQNANHTLGFRKTTEYFCRIYLVDLYRWTSCGIHFNICSIHTRTLTLEPHTACRKGG